jgi:hypothetical protein
MAGETTSNAHMGKTIGSLDKLTPEAMLVFARSLAGLSPGEVRTLKVLYVRNVITELKAELASMKASFAAGCIHWMIPLFWPFAIAEARKIEIAKRRARELIDNLRMAWRDDLAGEPLDLSFLQE